MWIAVANPVMRRCGSAGLDLQKLPQTNEQYGQAVHVGVLQCYP